MFGRCKHQDALWVNHFEWYCYACGFLNYDADLILAINAHQMGDMVYAENHGA